MVSMVSMVSNDNENKNKNKKKIKMKMKTGERNKIDSPEKADTKEKTNHYNLFGQPSFHDPGTPKGKRRKPGRSYPLDDLTDFAVSRHSLICIVFSDFVGEENEFSEVEKMQLRYAVNFTSVMTRQVLHVIKPGPTQFDYKNPPPHLTKLLSKIHPRPNHFKEQLMRWFKSTSPEMTKKVREGMLKMHALLTNPLETITFVKDCAIKKWPGDGFYQYPGADTEDFAIPEGNRRVKPGYVIPIHELTNFAELREGGMARYIFHELVFDVLKIPNYYRDSRTYSLNLAPDLCFSRLSRQIPLKIAGIWTHFAFEIFKDSFDLPEVEMWRENGELQRTICPVPQGRLEKTFAEFDTDNFQSLVDDDDLSISSDDLSISSDGKLISSDE